MELQERKEKLLHDAAYYRGLTFTLTKMTQYYGQKYSNTLAKAQKGDACAFCLLGKMFEESVHHAHEHRDYDYPPLGYKEASKIYYELAVIGGYDRAAYYLGESYMSEEDYGQAEKWMLHAEEHHIPNSCYKLGKIYHALWKKEEKEIYLEKAYEWKQKALREDNSESVWYDMAEFYKDILKSSRTVTAEQKQSLLSEMIIYYQKSADKQDFWERRKCYACEELMRIFLGDYGTAPDIEKAILYGETAMRVRSAYAAFRLGDYYVKQMPEKYEKVIHYLECAVDYPGRVDGASKLLKKYLEEHEIPQYLDTEATLLMEADSFYNLGRMYHTGRVVEKSMKKALYFYTRSMEGLTAIKEGHSANCYNLAYYFMSDLQKEGILIPETVWEEMEANRSKEEFHNGFDEEVAEVLADLNIRFHIIDIQAFQKQIQDIVLVFDIPNDKLCNLQSDFYDRGMMDRKDQKYLQEYITNLIHQLEEADIDRQAIILYQDLTALSDYAARCTVATNSVWWGMQERVGRKISDAYLDKILKASLTDRITKCSGQPENNYRIQCHDNYMHNWPEACKKVKHKYPNFLEWKESDEDDE